MHKKVLTSFPPFPEKYQKLSKLSKQQRILVCPMPNCLHIQSVSCHNLGPRSLDILSSHMQAEFRLGLQIQLTSSWCSSTPCLVSHQVVQIFRPSVQRHQRRGERNLRTPQDPKKSPAGFNGQQQGLHSRFKRL